MERSGVEATRSELGRQRVEEVRPLVYEELRRLAGHFLRRERGRHTLQPTALVHHVYLQVLEQRKVEWANRAQLLALAAAVMRRILVHHARDRAAARRGGGASPVTVEIDVAAAGPGLDVLALHLALERLAAIDLRRSRVVELKYFGGLTTAEIGRALDISPATVEREWAFARAWLYEDVEGERAP